jgi:hypothetical protein
LRKGQERKELQKALEVLKGAFCNDRPLIAAAAASAAAAIAAAATNGASGSEDQQSASTVLASPLKLLKKRSYLLRCRYAMYFLSLEQF